MAAIDRVVHHSIVLDLMPVESYCAQTAVAQQRRQRAADAAPAGAAGEEVATEQR